MNETGVDILLNENGRDVIRWQRALGEILKEDTIILEIEPQIDTGAKRFGVTQTVIIHVEIEGCAKKYFLKSPFEHLYSEEMPWDSAKEVYWRTNGYHSCPAHVPLLAAGYVNAKGLVETRGTLGDKLVMIEPEIEGLPFRFFFDSSRPYSEQEGLSHATLISEYFRTLHIEEPDLNAPAKYYRSLRDAFWNPTIRLLHANSLFWSAFPNRTAFITEKLLEWQTRLAQNPQRLRRVHLDFHPWNIILNDTGVNVIGRRIPGYGDPADDIACIMANDYVFSLSSHGTLAHGFRRCFCELLRYYTVEAFPNDPKGELLTPFFAKRLILFLSPTHYQFTSTLQDTLWSALHDLLNRKIFLCDLAEGEFGA
ncbi:hypothetical protein HUN27_18765 [Agrobacterium tumefaciens]|nr:hypothetical protein [Agrobacterium tumefaciens]